MNKKVKLQGLIIIPALFMCFISPPLSAQDRFPRPEFETEYDLPLSTHPAPKSVLYSYIDIALLILFLAAASFLALKVRYRAGIFWLMISSIIYFGFWRKGCVCSVGSIQNIALGLFDPSYTVPLVVVVFFMMPLISTLFFGRTYCAAVCPLGAIQDIVLLKPVKIPSWIARPLEILPYLYLGLAVLFSATGSDFIICRFDPFIPFFRTAGNFNIFLFGASFLILSVFVGRPYCRFLCPYGVLLRWMSRISIWHVSITPDDCIECRLCENSCPFDAIKKPAQLNEQSGRYALIRRADIRHLAILLVLLPVLTGTGVWLGSLVHVTLSQMHRTVRLAEQVKREDIGSATETTLESRTFRTTGQSTEDLIKEAQVIQKRFLIGCRIFGGFVGLVFSCMLISLLIRRKRDCYEPDKAACLSCGRCFSYCPREKLRRKNR